ncbi:hypothetical protein EJ05DRAFT_503019 [Pseudovirgaria hyperparasitica]|uniref:Heterokaryon incompatibility domain-containing protein n=1 Tax=Pseudovirgaria hyperparasitica TaxID=470096 RepID=A0A6A6W3E8_9PEZI|nr:uncharacterized protein EJ05DRAFT_503019 [Pseudovirgaria hyperparasitica]KAF2755561.1 hypothetical protein EJ05DRAFT_503019 [Pseudovirgaria hyperparasitica]
MPSFLRQGHVAPTVWLLATLLIEDAFKTRQTVCPIYFIRSYATPEELWRDCVLDHKRDIYMYDGINLNARGHQSKCTRASIYMHEGIIILHKILNLDTGSLITGSALLDIKGLRNIEMDHVLAIPLPWPRTWQQQKNRTMALRIAYNSNLFPANERIIESMREERVFLAAAWRMPGLEICSEEWLATKWELNLSGLKRMRNSIGWYSIYLNSLEIKSEFWTIELPYLKLSS